VDMVILASPIIPDESTPQLAEILGIEQDKTGFLLSKTIHGNSVETSRAGVFIAGCVEGPKDAQSAVVQAESAVSHVINSLFVDSEI